MRPILQIALDLMHLRRAEEIARDAVAGGADWIEAGTPLLKSEGAETLRVLRKAFPGKVIVADMKTMDVGGFEVEIAAKAGADVITVMGMADDGTIAEAVATAKRYGAKVMVDMMAVEALEKRCQEAEAMGAAYVCIHMGIDEQMHGHGTPLDRIKRAAGACSLPVAAAGGLNSETVVPAMKAGASILIVGGAIIKSKDVKAAAEVMRKAIDSGVGIATVDAKKYTAESLREAFSKVSAPNVADAQHKKGVILGLQLRNGHGVRMCGPALTVQTAKGDWAKPVEATERAQPGDVIIIDAGEGELACWGELAGFSAKVRGVAGVVIDGAVRDLDGIIDMQLPMFSRSVTPHAGEPKGYGGIGLEITVGGQLVHTGDWIIGDESGLVVVPKENAVEIANRAVDVMERENRIREEIKKGRPMSSVLELERWEQVR
jgi:3-hexulose-6-phosphate synthase/6-phospho-3-hexuloisomerase